MKIIVGLGNPGKEYMSTRHNLGFRVVDTLAETTGSRFDKKMVQSLVCAARIGKEKVILAKPQTFMNLSGEAVGPLLAWYKVGVEDLLVVVDDFDLQPGRVRLRGYGGSGGHKGLTSVITVLGTERFARLRLGIGRPPFPIDAADWALGRFSPSELVDIESGVKAAAQAAAEFVTGGLAQAMNLYNRSDV